MNAQIEARIALAVQKAELSFWSVIAEEFPEAESGDADPVAVGFFRDSAETTVRHWCHWNLPKEVTNGNAPESDR